MKTLKNLRALSSGLLGIALLLPASLFMLTMAARLLGARSPYDHIAPSFLQSPFNLLEIHKAQVIIVSLLFAILFNLPPTERSKRHWLNWAVALQGLLLLLILFAYVVIQHLRY